MMTPMAVEWMRTRDVFPALDGLAHDYTALDGEAVVGRVYRIEGGPGQGLWFWSMTAHRPGPRPPIPTDGREARRGAAGRRVVEAYERLLARGITGP
jgi:hypothetical protein